MRGPGRADALSGTRAERYQVVVHTEAATLAERGETGRSELDGVRVCAETSRRMACDAARVAMCHRDGEVVSVGRRQRTIPPHIRRALEERDRGCRYPGCASRFTEAHHVKHWADGGETSGKTRDASMSEWDRLSPARPAHTPPRQIPGHRHVALGHATTVTPRPPRRRGKTPENRPHM